MHHDHVLWWQKRTLTPAALILAVVCSIGLTAITIIDIIPELAARNTIVALGKDIHINGITVNFSHPRKNTGQPPVQAKNGYSFHFVTMSVRNTSAQTVEVIPLLQLHMKDVQGNVYEATYAPSDSNQLNGPLVPGDALREEIAFEVPDTSSGLYLVFEPGGQHGASVIVHL